MNSKNFIEGNIYFLSKEDWEYDYIQMYKDKKGYYPYIAINKKDGGLVFAGSDSYSSYFYGVVGFYRNANNKEIKWLNECIKINNIIPLDKIKINDLINFEIY